MKNGYVELGAGLMVMAVTGLGAFLVPGSPNPLGAGIILAVLCVGGLSMVIFGDEEETPPSAI